MLLPKKILNGWLGLLLISFFCACEKVIDVNLNEAAPKYVAEGTLWAGKDTVSVKLTQTSSYFTPDQQPVVNDASVWLRDGMGNETAIPFVGAGIYELPDFTAQIGEQYQLEIKVQNEHFTAQSTIPEAVNIDSVTYEYLENFFGEAGYEIKVHYTDPPAIPNYYRILLTVNDTLQTQSENLYYVFDDRFNDGKKSTVDFFRLFQPGDHIQIKLVSMDKPVFRYFTTLNDAINNQNGPAPANPLSNISGGALGYFGAFSYSVVTLQLPF